MSFSLRSPSDVLAAIPYVVGYHPAESVVVLGMHGRRLTFSARVDLPDGGCPLPEQVVHLLEVVLRQHCTAVFVVGFGPSDQVEPLLLALRHAYEEVGICVLEVLRAHDRRYWSYLCANPTCCPPEGTVYDPISSSIAAEWTLAGKVARRNREEYEAQLEPVTGAAREAMTRATDRAHERLVDLLTAADDEESAAGAMQVAGERALTEVMRRLTDGGQLTDDEVAWLSVLLTDSDVRDLAWLRVAESTEDPDLTRALWMDVLRRSEPDLVAAPATLYGLAAWRGGDGGMARLALERAIAQDPRCVLARKLLNALYRGLPPSALDEMAADLVVTPRSGTRRRRRSSSRRVGSPRA